MKGRKLRIGLVGLLGSEHLSRVGNVYNDLEPFGLLYIGGVAKNRDCDVRIFHPYQNANPSEEDITKEIVEFNPDIVGFSSMTNTFNRSVRSAEKIKSALPNIKVIFGGDHIGTNPSDVVNNDVIDIGVYGEGEETFGEILDGRDLKEIKGISYVEDGKLLINDPRKRVMDRTGIPFPMRDREILARSKVGKIMFPAPSEQTGVASLLFQFGCPLGCTYCSATTLYGSKLTRTSEDSVVEEMRDLKERFGINTAFFTDLTFNLNARLSENLCHKLGDANLGISWTAMVRPTSPNNQPILKSSTLESMAFGGCTKVGFGIESFESSAMVDYHRPTSLDEDFRILREIDRIGMLSKVFLIMGHPNETSDYYDKVLSQLKVLLPDEVRISYLTPFPGTQLWNMLEEKRDKVLLTTNYDDYTTFKPIMKMKHISPEDVVKKRNWILREYYSSREFDLHVREKVRKNPRLKKSYEEFIGGLRFDRVI